MKRLKNIFLSAVAALSLVTSSVAPATSAAELTGDPGWTGTDVHPNSFTNIHVSKGSTDYEAYCYNAGIAYPDNTAYTRYGFYEGMENLSTARGDQEKIDRVAAALLVGKGNNALGYSSLAASSLQSTISALNRHDNMGMNGQDQAPLRSWTVEGFEYDATQIAIWALDDKPTEHGEFKGKSPAEVMKNYSPMKEIFESPYCQAIYNYAMQHPLDKESVKAENIRIVSNGKTVDDKNPLVLDKSTNKTPNFTVDGYGGIVRLPQLPNGLQVMDAKTGKPVTEISKGNEYYVQGNMTEDKVNVDGEYAVLGDSYFWEPTTEPYPQRQNIVYLSTKDQQLNFPVVQKETETKKSDVNFSKVDVNGKEVEGAKLEVKDETGKVVDSWTSTKEKYILSLEQGHEYTMTETQAPAGYEIAEDITFRVTNEGTVEIKQEDGTWKKAEDSTVVMVDQLKEDSSESTETTTSSSEDTSSTDETTSSSEDTTSTDETTSSSEDTTSTDETTSSSEDTTSTDETTSSSEDTTSTDETTSSSEDTTSTDETTSSSEDTTSTEDTSSSTDETVKEDKVDVNFSKVDVNGKEVEGAKLEVKDEKGNVIDSWTSTKENHVLSLEKGHEYTMTETQAPAGYEIAEDITFRVTEDGVIEIKQADGTWKEAKDSTVVMIDEYKDTTNDNKDDKVDAVIGGKHDNNQNGNGGNGQVTTSKGGYVTKGNAKNEGISSLPQTGNKTNKGFVVLGSIIVMAVVVAGAIMMVRRRNA